MNTNILKKCVEELKKESPKIDYILGMLETVIELSGGTLNQTTKSDISIKMTEVEGSGLDTSIPPSYVTGTGPIAKLA